MRDSIFDKLAELERSINRELVAAARARRAATIVGAAMAALIAALAAAVVALFWGQ